MKKKILIEGMSCGHCVNHVKEALGEISGVAKVDVALDIKTAIIESDDVIEDKDIIAVIEDVGYDVVEITEV